MDSEETQWVQKYAGKALDYWRRRDNPFAVSEDYRRQLEDDLTCQYVNPLKRRFAEAIWGN